MNKLLTTFMLCTGVVLMTGSCGTEEEKKSETSKEIADPNSSLTTKFDDKIFSIPSPMQMALLLEESKSPYNEYLLNDPGKVSDYTSEYKNALNLGICGTDLVYVSIYKQNSIALKYLSEIENLTGKLGLEGAFDKDFMTRFKKNSTNKDSMMMIISDAFKKSDSFLKSNNRQSVSALILVGGWIESMYIACSINKEHANEKILNRIAEQTETLNTIITLLTDYNKKGDWDELIKDMKDLKFYFDQISIKYEYQTPVTNAKTKTTTLRHKIVVTIDSNVESFINQKIEVIRSKITE
ncbi:hypothetical protein [Fluviicola sp.]|jgi:hypothetical protein|uniref:hypothetical protein n=1 Tax=Fluviicola sp. TaxID=1917219 RepID=UPI00283A230E|nr:hypothetical protein [Fluviicola sp.]MDR0801998.1 hypothetical protein [Fluviicola sp.]